MNYDESTVKWFCSANNFCGMPMWLKYQNYLFSTVEEKLNTCEAIGVTYTVDNKAICITEV